MGWFDGYRRKRTREQRELYGNYEKVYTLVDACAALCFVTGSTLFFFEATKPVAQWLYLLGSILFLTRPGVTLLREFHLANLPMPGDDDPNRSST